MGKQGLQKQNRTDRILIAAALAILLIASGAFYFDGWMWGDRRGRGDKIGLLSNRVGDVRMKFEGDLKWQSAARGQDLIYNDSIFAGPGGQLVLLFAGRRSRRAVGRVFDAAVGFDGRRTLRGGRRGRSRQTLLNR